MQRNAVPTNIQKVRHPQDWNSKPQTEHFGPSNHLQSPSFPSQRITETDMVKVTPALCIILIQRIRRRVQFTPRVLTRVRTPSGRLRGARKATVSGWTHSSSEECRLTQGEERGRSGGRTTSRRRGLRGLGRNR